MAEIIFLQIICRPTVWQSDPELKGLCHEASPEVIWHYGNRGDPLKAYDLGKFLENMLLVWSLADV